MQVQDKLALAMGDGARASKWDAAFCFECGNLFPTSENVAVLAHKTSFPAINMKTIEFHYMGRTIPIRGPVNYGTQQISVDFYADSGHKLKHAFETWIEACSEGIQYGELTSDLTSMIAQHAQGIYTRDISLYQLDFDETQAMCRYIVHNAFPVKVEDIELDSDKSEIEVVKVTFAFSHFTLDNIRGERGNFLGTTLGKLSGSSGGILDRLAGSLAQEINGFLQSSGIADLANGIQNLPNNLINSVSSSFAESFSSALRDGLTANTEGFSSSFTQGLGALTSGLQQGVSAAQAAVNGVTNLVSSAANKLGSLAGSAAAAVGNALKGVSSSISSLISSGTSKLAASLSSGNKDMLEEARQTAQNMNTAVVAQVFQTGKTLDEFSAQGLSKLTSLAGSFTSKLGLS
jgi:hypothetical protein